MAAGILVVLVLISVLLLAMQKLSVADIDKHEFAFEILIEFGLISFKILLAASILLFLESAIRHRHSATEADFQPAF